MKTTKIPFCESIPDSWEEIPNRYLFEEHSVKVGDKSSDYQLLSLTTSGVKEKDSNAAGGKVPESYDNYQTVEKGDMIFCLFDLDCSAVFSGLSNYNGMITSAYDVFRPNPKYVEQHFLDYWFQYVFSNRYYKMYSKNIRYTVTREMFNGISTPVPPLAVQKKIGEFLDQKCSQIDALILNQERQIEKLKQYKQSLITEVVTKGLDPTVPLKDSGIEWIGKIPQGWSVDKTIRIFGGIGSGTTPKGEQYYIDGVVNFIQSGDITGGFLHQSKNKVTQSAINEIPALTIYKAPFLIIAMYGGSIGHLSISMIDACVNQACCVLNNPTCNFKFAFYCLTSAKDYLIRNAIGGGQPNISQAILKSLWFPTPTQEEQESIVKFLDNKSYKIDSLISKKQSKIQKLNQYKKSLIYEYVTGKKEVV